MVVVVDVFGDVFDDVFGDVGEGEDVNVDEEEEEEEEEGEEGEEGEEEAPLPMRRPPALATRQYLASRRAPLNECSRPPIMSHGNLIRVGVTSRRTNAPSA